VSTSFSTLDENWNNHVENFKADMAEVRAIVSAYKADLAEMRAIVSAYAARARACQEAADTRARQEAVAARDPPGRASQNDEYDDDKDEYDDDKDEYDDDNDFDEDAEDEYEDIVAQFFARVDDTMAEIQAMDDGFDNRAAEREKALADKANKTVLQSTPANNLAAGGRGNRATPCRHAQESAGRRGQSAS
jgi:hypothetical protein